MEQDAFDKKHTSPTRKKCTDIDIHVTKYIIPGLGFIYGRL